jgi:serine/threonine protein kinase
MNASPSLHPTDQTLHSFALGKLDDMLVEAVHKHLEDCPDCRRRAAEVTSDSFLGRLRDAQARPEAPAPLVSSTDGLSMLAAGPSAQAPPLASTIPPDLADHADYQILHELGRGGMGVVYLAQNKLMGRPEVLKVVGSHLITRPGVADRFLREIRSAAKLHHTNIVTAYSALRLGESLVLAMEYVEGLDLAKIIKAKGPLPVANACNYVHQSALGLQHAHEHGMVHRDIKPSNLMLAPAGKKAVVKVLDFGLAKVTSEGQAEGGLTREGQMLGTPDYIAPEQIRHAQSADIRADIYSLGCTLYYLLAGRPPFGGETLWDIYQAHFSMDASPLNLVRPEVPVEIAALVAKMMAKEPERRFQTPREVAQALTPFFKSGSAAAVGTKLEVSQPGRTVQEWASPSAGFAPAQPATGAAPVPTVAAKKATNPAQPGSMWDSLVEFRETKRSMEAAPVVAVDRRRPWKSWPLVAAAFLSGLIALGIIITIRDKNGRETKISAPDDSTVVVEGPPGNIEVRPSKTIPQDQPEVTSGGNPAQKAEVVPKDSPPVEPVRKRATEAVVVVPDSEIGFPADQGRFIPLFNGKDKTGWVDSPISNGEWRVVDGVLEGRGSGKPRIPAILVTQRNDFTNFRLRARFRYPEAGGGSIEIRYHYDAKGKSRSSYPVAHGLWPSGHQYAVPPGRINKLTGHRYGAGSGWNQPSEPITVTQNTWNTLEIEAVGNRISTAINGKKTAEFTDNDAGFSSGAIALSCLYHSVVQFQEIKIEEIPDNAPPQISADRGRSVSLFNVMDFEGWNGFSNGYVVEPRMVFQVKNRELVWTGTQGRIFLNKAYENFSFKFEYSRGSARGATSQAYGSLKFPNGKPCNTSAAAYPVGQIGFSLTNGEHYTFHHPIETGDLVLIEPEQTPSTGRSIARRTANTERAVGEWNEVEIRCANDMIQCFLNGREVNRLQVSGKILCSPGFHSFGTEIRFRNIQIIPLANPRATAK